MSETLSRSERLDRLRFNSAHKKLLVGSGIGWALDAMDVGLISFVMAALGKQWSLDSSTLSLIGSIGFVGMAIGASLGGLIADKIGRRQVFAFTLLIYGIATGASALATSVAALIVLRFFVGLGLGAELPVASTLVSEFAPRHIRGRMVVMLEAFWAVGWMAAALVSYFIIPSHPEGWRFALALGVVPTVYAIFVRLQLPESVRFLESNGRIDEAEAVVRSFEAASSTSQLGDQEPSEHVEGRAVFLDENAASIWAPSYRKRTVALWIIWFCINFSYYGAFIWIPSLLVSQGFTLVKSFEFTLIMTCAQLPGYFAAAWLIERWGRRSTLALFLAGSALAALGYGFASAPILIIAMGCTLSFFNLGAWGALYAIGPEIYPTSIRGTGTGSAAAFGRIASILAPLSVPVLMGIGGMPLVFAVLGITFFIGAASSWFLPEAKGAKLD